MTIEVLIYASCGLTTQGGGEIMAGNDNDGRKTIENLISACQSLLEVFEQYGYAKDEEFLKCVSFLAWYLNAEIDFRRRVGEVRRNGKEVPR
jgi:hypothetical protein